MRFVFVLAVLGLAGSQAQAGSASLLELTGIAHVAFRVSDIAVSREFYGKLGFEQAFEFNDARGTTTSYIKVNGRQFIELYRRGSDAEPLGLMHICFDVSDIERLRAAYLQVGLQPPAAVKARAGNLLFSLRDPEGQVIEYTQYLPGSLHWNARGQYESERRISDHLAGVTVAAKDPAAERAFYLGKLGFEDRGVVRLRVPGASGEEVELEPATPDWKPRIELPVADVHRAAAELRNRGLTVRVSGAEVLVTDPDGAVIAFTSTDADTAREILTLEQRAMEAWQKGDPDPVLALLDPDITYFHAVTTERLDGLPAVRALFERYRGRPLFDRFEILNPKVQVSGEVAVLTYLFVRWNGTVASRWNASQVYHQTAEGWRVLHTHWSMTRPAAAAATPVPRED